MLIHQDSPKVFLQTATSFLSLATNLLSNKSHEDEMPLAL